MKRYRALTEDEAAGRPRHYPKWWNKYYTCDFTPLEGDDDFMPELIEDYGPAEWVCTLIPKDRYPHLPVMDLISIGDTEPEPILYIGGRAISYTEDDILNELNRFGGDAISHTVDDILKELGEL